MAENHFDRLSDDLLRFIFNGVVDVKSLCRCLSVSKRFSSLAIQANSVSLRLPPPPPHLVIPPPPLFPFSKPKNNNLFTNLVTKLITTPLHFLHRVIISPAYHDDNNGPHCSPARLLKPFKDAVDFHVQLPDAPRGDDDTCCLLKWNAAFGKQLKSCVVLGAKEITTNNADNKYGVTNGGEEFDDPLTMMYNEELQLRVVWTISCLIAASSRHCLIKQLILDRPMLRRVEITDDTRQGTLVVEGDDVAEMRNDDDDEKLEKRSRVPPMKMKMWLVRRLELPGTRRVVKGATLVLIKAVDKKRCDNSDDDDLLMGAFEGEDEKEIVREMAKKKKKMYTTLEIDSF